METLYVVCAILGGGLLVLQICLGLLGLDPEIDAFDPAGDAPDSLNLLGLRSIAAGLGFFGLAGLALEGMGAAAPLVVAGAAVMGLATALATALLMRSLLRLQADGSIRESRTLGAAGTVYLGIAGEGARGKVQITVQGRTVELEAISREPLATGTPVLVVDVLGPDLVEVAPTPRIGEILDGSP